MRPRRSGILDELIRRATENGQQGELAALLGVTRHAIYKWNRGTPPGNYWQMQINGLCQRLRIRLVFPHGPKPLAPMRKKTRHVQNRKR